MDHEHSLLIIRAMRRQEETKYISCDYLNMDNQDNSSSSEDDFVSPDANGNSRLPCDATCRQIMFYWMVRVVDYFPSMNRETVAYAMSYLDRFMQSDAGAPARKKRSVFQLAAISCLYLAVKIHERNAVTPSFLEKLSNDEYSVKDVERMECVILKALQWRLNTPTALAFLREYLAIIPSKMLQGNVREEVFQAAKFQTEVALSDYKYVTVNASTVAYGALLNALDMFQVENRDVAWLVAQAALIVRNSIYTVEIQQSLARDHVDHASLQGSPVSVGYEDDTIRPHAIKSASDAPEQHHRSSPRTVLCKSA